MWPEEEVWKIRMFLLFRPGVACHLSAVIYYWLRQTKLVIFNLTASDVRYNQHWLSWTDPPVLPNDFFLSCRILSWEKFEKKCRRLWWKFDIELDLIILLRKIKLLNLNNNAMVDGGRRYSDSSVDRSRNIIIK